MHQGVKIIMITGIANIITNGRQPVNTDEVVNIEKFASADKSYDLKALSNYFNGESVDNIDALIEENSSEEIQELIENSINGLTTASDKYQEGINEISKIFQSYTKSLFEYLSDFKPDDAHTKMNHSLIKFEKYIMEPLSKLISSKSDLRTDLAKAFDFVAREAGGLKDKTFDSLKRRFFGQKEAK